MGAIIIVDKPEDTVKPVCGNCFWRTGTTCQQTGEDKADTNTCEIFTSGLSK